MSDLITIAEFYSDMYMQSTGTVPSNAVQAALDIAEGDISEALGYPIDDSEGAPTFTTTTWTEYHRWPTPNRPLILLRPRLQALTSVTAMHALTCDCAWTEITECAYIHTYKTSVIKFRICNRAASCWAACSCPSQIEVVYTAGWTAAEVEPDTALGRRLRQAIALQALVYIQQKDFYTDGGGSGAVTSYSSLGYSETREILRTTTGQALGMGLLSEAAARLLRPLLIRRSPVLRSQ